jgi:hypothetical protein
MAKVNLKVTNTGTVTNSFAVGVSAGRGANLDHCSTHFIGGLIKDYPMVAVKLTPGQVATLSLDIDPPVDPAEYLIAKVWAKNTNPAVDSSNYCLDGDWIIYPSTRLSATVQIVSVV